MSKLNRVTYASMIAGSLLLIALALASCGSQDLGAQVEATTAKAATATPSPLAANPELTPVLTRTVQASELTAPSETKPAPATQPASTAVPTVSQTGLPAPDTVPISPTIAMPSSRQLQRWVEMAMEDLALKLGADEETIELLEVRPVVWPDGSLGCPQPGMRYIQVTVDGLLIRLRVGDEVYDYHSSVTEPPFLCLQDREGPPDKSKLTPVPALTLSCRASRWDACP